jgi:phosphoribosyl-ATP pyrophosphohydrolase
VIAMESGSVAEFFFGDAIELVRQFHVAMGLPVAERATDCLSTDQLRALAKPVVEEASELNQAVLKMNIGEVIKELADVLYSTLGVAVALDLQLDDAFARQYQGAGVLSGSDEVVSDDQTELLARPILLVRSNHQAHGWPIPASPTIVENRELVLRISREVASSSLRLHASLERRNLARLPDNVAEVLRDCMDLVVATDIPLARAFLDIHNNNMTKRPAVRKSGVSQKPQKGAGFEKLDLSRLVEPEDLETEDRDDSI